MGDNKRITRELDKKGRRYAKSYERTRMAGEDNEAQLAEPEEQNNEAEEDNETGEDNEAGEDKEAAETEQKQPSKERTRLYLSPEKEESLLEALTPIIAAWSGDHDPEEQDT